VYIYQFGEYTEIAPTRFVSCRSHGRRAGYPAPPRTDPGVRNYRTGLLNDTRFRTPDPSGFAIPLSEVGLRDPALRVRPKFPLRAMYPRQPLPHVSGATVSEYYGLIRLPTGLPSSSVWLGRRTYKQGAVIGRFRLTSVSGFPLVWLSNRISYTTSTVPGADGASQVPDVSLHTCHALMTPTDPPESHPIDSFVLASATLTTWPSALYCFGCNEALPDIQGSANSLVAYMVPCVRFTDLVRQPQADSAIGATLGRGGWLDLTPQGLAPCKKRQASLGALTVCRFTNRSERIAKSGCRRPRGACPAAQNRAVMCCCIFLFL
jgi:hypothetical protein